MLLIPRRTGLDVVSLSQRGLIGVVTKHYYMLNIYAVGLIVSEKNIFEVLSVISLWEFAITTRVPIQSAQKP